MITDLMNSKCECPSATISQNEMIRQQDSMCEILQITTKLVQQDQNFLVDYGHLLSNMLPTMTYYMYDVIVLISRFH
jgi:hypothetical protein